MKDLGFYIKCGVIFVKFKRQWTWAQPKVGGIIIERRAAVASLLENMNFPNKKVGRSLFFDQLGLFLVGALVF